MLNVTVNGENKQLPDGTTVEDLLAQMEVRREYLAVERNRSIVPRTEYEKTALEDGDTIEIVSLVGGG